MRPEIELADRRFAVRRAAAAWRRAGLVDAAAEAAIATQYADDRVRTTRVFRALFFLFTWFGYSTAYGFFLAVLQAVGIDWNDTTGFAAVHAVIGLATLAAAEGLTSGMKLRRFGIEEACVWIGYGYLVGSTLWWIAAVVDPGVAALVVLGGWVTAGFATLAAWRWATPGMGVVAAAATLVALTQAPWNQLLWLLVAGVVAWPVAHLSLAGHVSPEHRKRFAEAFAVFVAAFYFALHVEVVEHRLFFWLGNAARGRFATGGAVAELPPVGVWAIQASLLAMLLVPFVLLTLGMRRRFRTAIVLGLLSGLATAISFAARWHLEPGWFWLLLFGATLVGGAIVVRRRFDARPGAEWRGLTARALVDDRESAGSIEALAMLATVSPAARAAEAPGFEGGGGEFGGGGASATF